MTPTGIRITENKKQGAIEIIVDSEKYNEDLMFHNVTLETEMKAFRKSQFTELFKAS